jgi:Ca2+-binding EF-hand superfamily protein
MKKLIIPFIIGFIAVSALIRGQSQKDIEKNAREAYTMLLKETDKNKDGKISKTEFFAIWKDKKTAEEKYKAWDVDNDGFITEEEYVKVVMDMGKKKKK